MPFDLKTLTVVLGELENERGISKEKTIEAIEYALATAYKKEYGKRDQVVRVRFDMNTGTAEFEQVKQVVDETTVRFKEDEEDGEETSSAYSAETATAVKSVEDASPESEEEEKLPLFNPEKHMLLEDAKKMKKDAVIGDEIVFPLEARDDFGRIAAQTAKQIIIQKIREAEKEHLSHEFGEREGEIVSGTVQRVERGNIFVDLGRAVGILAYDEQIPGERFRAGERIRAYLFRVEETSRGVFLRLSRSHPNFLTRLFESESPEVAQGLVVIKAIAREPGSRSKLAVASTDDHIDPVGALVGQRGVRVSTVMSELGGEKIDVIEWSENPEHFVEDALSPAKVLSVAITDEEGHQAVVTVTEDQQSLAIGRGGQNVRLAAKLTGWRIDIRSAGDHAEAEEGDEAEGVEEGVTPTTSEDTPEDVSAEADVAKEDVSPAQDETPKEETPETKDKTGDDTKGVEGVESETKPQEEKE
ncbi:MAG TPA: transcription termination factor NusA [Candidatus Paceibacterota bacterium]|nr:transcription termination factor NusA [Candidatus Paceibacterota bacterium]